MIIVFQLSNLDWALVAIITFEFEVYWQHLPQKACCVNIQSYISARGKKAHWFQLPHLNIIRQETAFYLAIISFIFSGWFDFFPLVTVSWRCAGLFPAAVVSVVCVFRRKLLTLTDRTGASRLIESFPPPPVEPLLWGIEWPHGVSNGRALWVLTPRPGKFHLAPHWRRGIILFSGSPQAAQRDDFKWNVNNWPPFAVTLETFCLCH